MHSESVEIEEIKTKRNNVKEHVILWWFVVEYQHDKNQAVN